MLPEVGHVGTGFVGKEPGDEAAGDGLDDAVAEVGSLAGCERERGGSEQVRGRWAGDSQFGVETRRGGAGGEAVVVSIGKVAAPFGRGGGVAEELVEGAAAGADAEAAEPGCATDGRCAPAATG